jgi:hypothetical protein
MELVRDDRSAAHTAARRQPNGNTEDLLYES